MVWPFAKLRKYMATDKTAQLKKVRDEVWALKESPLYKYRVENKYHAVLGEGNHDAKIVFIGEAPGKTEAETGRPFCGAAGKVLDDLLASVGLDRKDVYITNVVKDRPPNNRDPEPMEIELYSPFLWRQIEIIQPEVIATLGRFSMTFILEKFDLPEKSQSISVLHGKQLVAIANYGPIVILPLYHPAVTLHGGVKIDVLKKDFEVLKKL